MMKYTAKRTQCLRRQMTVLGSYGSGLILSLGLAACATLKLPPAVVGENPAASAVASAPKPAAATALVGKSRRGTIAAAETKSPAARDEDNAGSPGNETLPPQDRLSSVYFPLGSYSFDREAEAAIKSHARKLIANPRLLVTLIGHTDDLGSKEYNDALCIRRADAVKQALLDQGVAPRQIRLSGRYGYEKAPPRPCSTDACRKLLRRVELRFDSTTLSH